MKGKSRKNTEKKRTPQKLKNNLCQAVLTHGDMGVTAVRQAEEATREAEAGEAEAGGGGGQRGSRKLGGGFLPLC